ncbi:hypothetical protein [Nakamurella lactea]|uniref:hypothetical protein n=1 Tax=Nakamurella lactea TaxID=459515 RepID=UPI000411229E|nr:hypothetical protein [Nakamurella lactea]
MQASSITLVGILLLALITVESGGYFLTKVGRGSVPANTLQKNFFRAGHAHAAVLLVLSIAVLAVVDQAGLSGFWEWVAKTGIPISAILMPAGFFLSVIGKDPKRPNGLLGLLWVGATLLTIGLLTAGIALVRAGITA